MPKPSWSTGLTDMEFKFVNAHAGNDTDAARQAGYADPNVAAHKLMKRQRVLDALQKRRSLVEKECVRITARTMVTKSEIMEGQLRAIARLERMADIAEKAVTEAIAEKKPAELQLAAQARVCSALSAAWDKLAELCQHKVVLSADLSKYFEGRTLEEREFFCIHGYFPDTVEPAEPGTSGDSGTASGSTGTGKVQ